MTTRVAGSDAVRGGPDCRIYADVDADGWAGPPAPGKGIRRRESRPKGRSETTKPIPRRIRLGNTGSSPGLWQGGRSKAVTGEDGAPPLNPLPAHRAPIRSPRYQVADVQTGIRRDAAKTEETSPTVADPTLDMPPSRSAGGIRDHADAAADRPDVPRNVVILY
jgi:hypothetical protein